MNRAWAQEPALLRHGATTAVPGDEPGKKKGPSEGADGDESQEVSRSPRGSRQTSKEQNCTGAKRGNCRNLVRVQTQPAELHARSAGKGQTLAISLQLNQKTSSAAPSSCSRKALATRTGNYFRCRHTLPGAAALAPGVCWP